MRPIKDCARSQEITIAAEHRPAALYLLYLQYKACILETSQKEKYYFKPPAELGVSIFREIVFEHSPNGHEYLQAEATWVLNL